MQQRIAHTITVDHRPWDEGGGLYIEGVRVPFAISPEVHIDHPDGVVGTVSVTFYADNIEVVSKHGKKTYPVTAPFHRELEWARREGRRLVHEGMVDILEWLWKGRAELDVRSMPQRWILGLDEGQRQALVSTPTHSQSEQNTDRMETS